MKICILVSNSLRKDPRVIKQVRSAIDARLEVNFIGYRDKFFSKEFLDSLSCRVSIVDLGENYIGELKSLWKRIYRQFCFFYYPIKFIVEFKPDIIHANDFDTLIQAYFASKITGSKVLYDSHEICAENIGVSNRLYKRLLILIMERFIVKRIAAMVSVSNAAATYFESKYRIGRPTVITNCPVKTHLVKTENKLSQNFEVLYQGLMSKGRGYEEFVKSAHFIQSGVMLVLRGYGSIEAELRSMILNENISDRVRFDKPVEVRDIIVHAKESHIGVVLTQPINKNFELTVSNKLFEYIHAGLPVLMSDVPEHRYLNDKYNFGIILKDISPNSIAENINKLAENRELYNLLRINAIKAAEILCWENESLRLLDLYNKLSA